MSSSDEPKKEHRMMASASNIATFFAASVGISLERIAKVTGLNPATLMDPDKRIPEKFILEILRLLNKIPSKKNLSLELAQTAPFIFLGSPWRLIRMAPDLCTMLTLFAKNSDLLSDQLKIEFIATDTEAIVQMYHPFDEIDDGMGGEVCVGIGTRVMREYFGEDVLTCVKFRHAARKPISVYEDFFKVPVTFQADFNALVFPIKALNWPNKNKQVEALESLEWRLSRLRQEFGLNDTDELADIREAIAYNATKGDFSVFRLTERMAINPRNLQRRLSKSGTKASVLLDEARYAKALELLANEQINIEDIASQLGFNEERSFRRAFQRWSQKTPAQVRREMNDEK